MTTQTYERLCGLRSELDYMAKVATKTFNDAQGVGEGSYHEDPSAGEVLYLCAALLKRTSAAIHDALLEEGDDHDE